MVKWVLRHPLFTIIACAVLARIVVFFLYRHVTHYPDSDDYIYLSELLSAFNLAGYEGERSPGYPLLLCLSGRSLVVTAILQSTLGVATLLLTFKSLKMLPIISNWALGFTLLCSIYTPFIFFEFAILSETITLFFISLICYFFLKIFEQGDVKKKYYAGLALSCFYLVLIKPFYIFLPLLLILFLFAKYRFTKGMAKSYLLIAILSLAPYWGWSLVNKVNTGYFVPTTFFGFNLAQNCVSFAENTNEKYEQIGHIYAKYREKNSASGEKTEMSIWDAYPELRQVTGLSFPDLSNELYDYSVATIKMNPAAYLKQVGISWFNFWKTSLYYDFDAFSVNNANYAVKYISMAERIAMQLIKIIFLLLIPYNLLIGFRNRKVDFPLIVSVTVLAASLLQAFVTYGTNSRFSFPFEILIAMSVLINLISVGNNSLRMK